MEQAPENPTEATRRAHLGWLLKVAASLVLLLLASSMLGRLALVRPIYDPRLFRVEDGVRTVFVGASHAAVSFDPRHFADSASVGKNGEALFLTHHKLRHVLAGSAGVERVVLAFSPIHTSAAQDRLLYGADGGTRASHMNYLPFVDPAGRDVLRRAGGDYRVAAAKHDWNLPLGVVEDLRLLVNYHRGGVRLGAYPAWGGFAPTPDFSRLEEEVLQAKIDFYFNAEDGTPLGISEISRAALVEIVELCDASGVELVLVDTPVHPRFHAKIPPVFLAAHVRWIRELQTRFPGLRFVDHSSLYAEDALFSDGDHLSASGTQLYSAFCADSGAFDAAGGSASSKTGKRTSAQAE